MATEASTTARSALVIVVRRQTQAVAARLEDELGDERVSFIDTCRAEVEELPRPDLPLTVGLDGGYVHSAAQRSRRDGWFEVIAGKVVTTRVKMGNLLRRLASLLSKMQAHLILGVSHATPIPDNHDGAALRRRRAERRRRHGPRGRLGLGEPTRPKRWLSVRSARGARTCTGSNRTAQYAALLRQRL